MFTDGLWMLKEPGADAIQRRSLLWGKLLKELNVHGRHCGTGRHRRQAANENITVEGFGWEKFEVVPYARFPVELFCPYP